MKRAFATITLAIIFAAIGSPRGVLAEKLHLQASFAKIGANRHLISVESGR